MPCRDYSNDNYQNDYYYAKTKLDKVTSFLCYVLKRLSAPVLTTLFSGNKELSEWWSKHQIEDRMREEQEERVRKKRELKNKALSKLTDEEKKALGL